MTSQSDTEALRVKLKAWEEHLLNYRLPEWEEIPNIGLYMDQTISLLEGYFNFLAPDIKGETLVTKAMINNYVRLGVVPRPENKRYYRIHLAYLIVICLLKQTLNISQIKKGFPPSLSEEEVRVVYNKFRETHHSSANYFCRAVSLGTAPLRGEEQQDKDMRVSSTEDLIIASAIIGGLNDLLADALFDEFFADEDAGAFLVEE